MSFRIVKELGDVSFKHVKKLGAVSFRILKLGDASYIVYIQESEFMRHFGTFSYTVYCVVSWRIYFRMQYKKW